MIELMEAPVDSGLRRPARQVAAPDQLVKSTYTIVLAGGRGSRLKQLTDWCAKPAVPFAGKHKIIDFTLSNCFNSGIRKVSVLTQYQGQSLGRHIKQGWSALNESLGEFFDVVPPAFKHGPIGYTGTANAVYQNLDLLRDSKAKFVLVLSGDHVYKMDYSQLIADHVRQNADVTVACIEVPLKQATEFGVVGVDAQDRIRVFEEKPAHPTAMPDRPDVALASMGIYVFDASFLIRELERDHANPDSLHDFGRDILPAVIAHGNVFAHDFSRSCVDRSQLQPYWRDVGTLDAYWQANMDLLHPLPDFHIRDHHWPILSTHPHGSAAGLTLGHDEHRGTAIESWISRGCQLFGATVRRSMLFSHAQVGSGSSIDDSLLLPHATVGRDVVIRKAIIDSHCVLPDGIRIGVDPVEDRARFTVSEQGVTLVTPEMLGQSGLSEHRH
jgi:glucose-1-phosphate adenylyltransferase